MNITCNLATKSSTALVRGQYERVAGATYQPTNTRLFERNYVWRGTFEAVEQLTRSVEFCSALEVGCAEGLVLQLLVRGRACFAYVGTDLAREFLNKAKLRLAGYDISLLQSDVQSLPFDSRSFDLTICLAVLEHVPNIARAVAELSRVTKQYCIVMVPLEAQWPPASFLRGLLCRVEPHRRESLTLFTLEALKRKISTSGFRITNAVTFEWLPLNFIYNSMKTRKRIAWLERLDHMLARYLPSHHAVLLLIKDNAVHVAEQKVDEPDGRTDFEMRSWICVRGWHSAQSFLTRDAFTSR